MHELALCEAIADTVTQRAAGRRVSRVDVRIGHLRQVVPESLTYSWRMVTQETALAGAALDVEHVPAEIECHSCGQRVVLDVPSFLCPDCLSEDVRVLQGDELLLVSIELTAS
jgi:hydrogenase nickel incorporation protein HypA/HybF